MWSNEPNSTKWIVAAILASIGGFFLFMTYGAMIVSKRSNRFVSGVQLVGGFFIFLGFILSPIKWLAFLCLLDPGVWMLPYSLWLDFKTKTKDDNEVR